MDTHETTGFSDVDASGRSAALVDYLELLAQQMAHLRREGYQMLGLRAGAAVLDVGCGAGEVCVELAGLVGPTGRVDGIDPSQAMIDAARDAARASGRAIDLRIASVHALPFPDDGFDAVRAERVFQHLDDPAGALREMLRVTRPGGHVMLIDPDHGTHGLALDDPADYAVFEVLRRALMRRIVNPHSGTRLRGMMSRAGLVDLKQAIRIVEMPFGVYRRAIFLDELLDAAVTGGEISSGDSKRFVKVLEERDRAGTFQATSVAYSVVGTRLRG